MQLNTIQPAPGSKIKKHRVGRGIGCGKGKTCGKGHKGQKARSGSNTDIKFFQGGQMPLQRRLPKFGFSSRKSTVTAEIRASELNKVTDSEITVETLKNNNIIPGKIKFVKVIKGGELSKAVILKGIKATKGALEQIKTAGGSVVTEQ